MKTLFILSILVLLIVAGCSAVPESSRNKVPPDLSTHASKAKWVTSTLERLTLQEKVAQLVFVWTDAGYLSKDSDRWKELERLTVERKLGGFIFSIGDVYEYAVQINKLQRLSAVPLMITADFEYGAGMRIRRSTTFPRAMAVGATRDERFAYEMGKAIAQEARALGVHQNYAPVVDVNNNPKNPVINTRSFGDDVKLVSTMALAFIKGTQEGGVVATVKHFPGHGDTDIDTHLKLPVLTFPRERFNALELPPFKEAFDAGVLSVMVGHISIPTYDTLSGIPATVSPNVSTGLLKRELGFRGLIVTDAMTMRGVSSKYHPGESAVLAIKAGTDLVLMPPDADIATDAIVAAVKRGEIPVDRIDQSVAKLLVMKQWLGLDQNKEVDVEKVFEVVGSVEHRLLAREIARRSITVLGNAKGILPFHHAEGGNVLDLVCADDEDPSNGRALHAELQERMGNVGFALIDPRSDSLEYAAAFQKASSTDLIVCQLHYYTRSGEMTGFIPDSVSALINRILRLGKPFVGISFGNPYVVMDFPAVDAYVCAYSGSPVMIEAAAEVLFGEEPARGKLPITIPGVYAFGSGVEYPKVALRNGLAQEAGFDPMRLEEVDRVVESAIRDSAFPGAQLLVARNGIIVRHRAYGFYDYGVYASPVDQTTLYDLASVTKVIATTSAMMRLVEERKINLEDPVVNYIPEFGQQGKEHITVYNLMLHNSGLPAWRRFYDFCGTPQCVLDSVYATGLVYHTGDSTIYSDLGLVTIGKIIERVSGKALDTFVDSLFFKPLGMKSTMYNPPSSLWDHIAPTEVDSFWQKTFAAVRGRVHDENAAILGGVSGHAGLFSRALDLARILQMLLNGGSYDGRRYLQPETIQRFITRQSETSSRAIGWDTKTSPRSFSGKLTSMKTFLHTGFTGTSVVVDPEKNLIIVFLTNRVHPTRNNQKIAQARPAVHDAIVSALRVDAGGKAQ